MREEWLRGRAGVHPWDRRRLASQLSLIAGDFESCAGDIVTLMFSLSVSRGARRGLALSVRCGKDRTGRACWWQVGCRGKARMSSSVWVGGTAGVRMWLLMTGTESRSKPFSARSSLWTRSHFHVVWAWMLVKEVGLVLISTVYIWGCMCTCEVREVPQSVKRLKCLPHKIETRMLAPTPMKHQACGMCV